jgi:ubiquinone biosynthesis protein
MFSSITNLLRLFKIFRTLAEYDCLFFLENLKAFPTIGFIAKIVSPKKSNEILKLRKGQRLALALQNLGPTFIKLGQALSVRSDIVGEEISRDLKGLQDSLPPFSSKTAIQIIEENIGKKIAEVFDNFEEKPIAAASIAQVHFAVEKESGMEVAIKVLRPNIREKFFKDIDLLLWIAQKVEKNLPKYRRLRSVKVIEDFAQTAKFEMDFLFEAAAASELAENFKDDLEIKIPKIFWRLTTSKVLVLERFRGIRIDDIQGLKNTGHDVNEVLRKSANIFMKQALRDGFFHADMHPGNVLVDSDGKIAVFDFGIMGRIDRKIRLFLAEMLLGFLNKDYKRVAELHFEMGIVPENQDIKLFEQACRSIGEPIMDLPQNQISVGRLLEQLFNISNNFEMRLLPELFLLQKTMVMAEGIGRILNPNLNIWEISRDLIEDWGKDNFSIKAKSKDRISEFLGNIKKFGNVIENLSKSVTSEGIKVIENTPKNAFDLISFWKGIITASVILLVLQWVFG